MKLDEHFWSQLYANNATAWDAGAVTTPIKKYIDQLTDSGAAILIPGCGNGYEAGYLLEKGFTNITVVDISKLLCQRLEEKFTAAITSKNMRVICENFFNLVGEYDLVLEQTFFCAIDPRLRPQYAKRMYELLKPGGRLVGVLFKQEFEDGPPFGGTAEEYRHLFQPWFRIETMENCYNSIHPRKDTELFMRLIK